MTREKFIKELNFNCKVDGKEVWLNIMPCLEKLLDEHEAQMKAKDEQIERLKDDVRITQHLLSVYYKLQAKKARSIIAMLFWEWKKSEREAKIERYDDWENGVSFGEDKKAEELFKKAYAMLKGNR